MIKKSEVKIRGENNTRRAEMGKYILYGHDGAGNHGCEALVRSTIQLLGADCDHTVLISRLPDEDRKYGLDSLCKIVERETKASPDKNNLAFLRAYWALKVKKDYRPIDYLAEGKAASADRNDIALSIGGDTYCYGGTDRQAKYHNVWKYNGLKTVYWGCSIEPELLQRKEIADDISRFDLITARETISYEALKKINPRTILVSDSAFMLGTKELPLPDQFVGCDLIGINSSPLIEKSESVTGLARSNYEKLIEYILKETNYKILLIPHVIWDNYDDRTVLNALYDKYEDSERVFLVDDCNCEELKGYISRCKFFVGARTHATIAAYSSKIPTLVVGYSVKSRGIARDIFGDESHYVLPTQALKSEKDLTEAFCWMMAHEGEIRHRLELIMPEYCQRSQRGVEAVKLLSENLERR